MISSNQALLPASEEKAIEKLKQLLACVVDKIVVEGRDHIRPYYFVPGVLTVFPSRRRTGIEPARELVAPSSVLKTAGPTRNPDASGSEDNCAGSEAGCVQSPS
jgi:hypothetical protein